VSEDAADPELREVAGQAHASLLRVKGHASTGDLLSDGMEEMVRARAARGGSWALLLALLLAPPCDATPIPCDCHLCGNACKRLAAHGRRPEERRAHSVRQPVQDQSQDAGWPVTRQAGRCRR